MADGATLIILVVITLLLPPLGVFFVSGFSVDFLINIVLTILAYFPGWVHAFYVEYVWYRNQDPASRGIRAPGVFSDRVQSGRGW